MRTFARRTWRVLRWPIAVLALVAIAIQFVPYGWWHENPPVIQDAPWPDAASEAIARESCYSCHSNETNWPLYSYVAPMSWLVRSDVEAGRDEFNMSDWGEDGDEAFDAIEMIQLGEMPPGKYTLIHRGAALTAEERDILVQALRTMAAADDDHGDDGHDDD
ncbi:MAG: heme-binding domain-containing protein [Ilumatobacteraceae bacterium]